MGRFLGYTRRLVCPSLNCWCPAWYVVGAPIHRRIPVYRGGILGNLKRMHSLSNSAPNVFFELINWYIYPIIFKSDNDVWYHIYCFILVHNNRDDCLDLTPLYDDKFRLITSLGNCWCSYNITQIHWYDVCSPEETPSLDRMYIVTDFRCF